jgi:hypothetical protein
LVDGVLLAAFLAEPRETALARALRRGLAALHTSAFLAILTLALDLTCARTSETALALARRARGEVHASGSRAEPHRDPRQPIVFAPAVFAQIKVADEGDPRCASNASFPVFHDASFLMACATMRARWRF